MKRVLRFSLSILLGVALPKIATAAASQALLHMPWALLSTQLQNSIQSSAALSAVPSQSSLNAGGYQWNLTNTQVQGQISVASPTVNASSAVVQISNAALQMTIGQISVDQTITTNVDGATINVHLVASCGPVQLSQPSAQAQASFVLNWNSGSPQATLNSMTLGWPNSPWTVAPFNCQGPSDFASILHQQIVSELANPSVLQPYLSSILSQYVTAKLQTILSNIRQPFGASTGSASLPLQVGALTPVTTGIVAEVTVGTSDPQQPLAPLPVPTAAILASLSTSQPELVGGIDVINFILNNELAARPTYTQVNLQSNSTFSSLMQSPIMQFFIWSDLLNYGSQLPFYLNIATPKNLSLSLQNPPKQNSSSTNNVLTTQFNLYALIQSWRSSAWWSYVTIQGLTTAQVTLSVASGVLNYQTAIMNPNAQVAYGAAYKNKYHPSDSPPKSDINSALSGNQPALSGSVAWPVVNLGSAGSYQVSGMRWLNASTFSMPWSLVNNP
jgi:hypothetical protein